jgi:hypothetical protein
MLSYEQQMKRNPSIERLFRWRYFSHEKAPKHIIPPRSVIRLVRADPDWYPGLNVGEEFRIGYYRRQDGPNCIWLVDAAAEYIGTWDQKSLPDHFEVVSLSDETDTYGLHRPVLEPLSLIRS